MTVTSSPAGEHAGTRHTVDTLTSDALDELYDDRDQLRAQLSDMTRDRDRWKWYRDDAERRVRVQRARAETAEAALAALRKEQDEYEENVVGDLNETVIGLSRQAARAEATIARVHAALATFDGRGVIRIGGGNFDIPTAGEVLDAVRAALEEPEESPRTTVDNPATSSDNGPSVAAAVGDGRRWFDVEKGGE